MSPLQVVAFLLLSFTLFEICYAQIVYNSLSWVVAEGRESQVESCSRIGLLPTDKIIFFDWNSTSIGAITRKLNFQSWNISNCCSSSFWCSTSENNCTTHSYGKYFDNYGSLPGNDTSYKPVYTCKAPLPSVSSFRVDSLSQSPRTWDSLQTKHITLKGEGFGLDDNATRVSIAGENCGSLEICSHVCAKCDASTRCAPDSQCIRYGSTSRCFPYCGGPDDKSCPCDSKCMPLDLDAYSIGRHFCTPQSFDIGSDVCDGYLQNEIRCDAPLAKSVELENQIKHLNYSATIGSAIFVGPLLNLVLFCDVDSDCFDSNICTMDLCDGGSCRFRPIAGCLTDATYIADRSTNFYYATYVRTQQFTVQQQFVDDMVHDGTLSSISNSDDYPIQYLNLEFNFPFFGELVSSVGLNPNGVITLPPFQPCTSFPIYYLVRFYYVF